MRKIAEKHVEWTLFSASPTLQELQNVTDMTDISVKKMASWGNKFGRVKKWQNQVLLGRYILQTSMV